MELYLTAHAAKVDQRTIRTLRERLGAPAPRDRPEDGAAAKRRGPGRLREYRTAIETFGDMRLRDLERGAGGFGRLFYEEFDARKADEGQPDST